MKKILLSLIPALISALCLTSCGSTHSDITSFYRKHRSGQHVNHITLPRWIIRLGGHIAANQLDESESEWVRPLVRRIDKLRLLIGEDQPLWTPAEQKAFQRRLSHSGFEEFLYIRDRDEEFQFLIHEVDRELRDILVLFRSQEESGMIALRTHISLKDLSEVLERWLQRKKEEKQLEREEPPKRKIPQV